MVAIPTSTMKMKLFFFSFFLFMASLPFTITTSTATKHLRFATKLIHHDSIFSPYYNPNAADRARHMIERSIARKKFLAKAVNSFATINDIRTDLIPTDTGREFMVNLSIGDPPAPQLLTMDTGSSLLWLQCLPCTKCFEQFNPYFDPSKSSTYANIPCDSPSCTVLPPNERCDAVNDCKYSLRYLDGTTSSGNVASEKLTFLTSDEGTTTTSDVIFGCGHDSVSNFRYDQRSGFLGLGPGDTSLVTKLGSKFSYCLGNIDDVAYPYNQLILGDGAKIEGNPTPLDVFNSYYYLTLEGISVGDKRLNIDPQVFQRKPSGSGGVIIDSGSTITFLADGAYVPLSNEIQNLLAKFERITNPDYPTWLCYKGVISQDLKEFPAITFHFAGGADLVLDILSTFRMAGSNAYCLAIRSSSPDEINLIGVRAQQGYNVAHDLVEKKIYFHRIDCQLLES